MRLLAILILAMLMSRAASAQCPTSTVGSQAGPASDTRTSVSPRDAVSSRYWVERPDTIPCTAEANAGYDLVQGRVYAYALNGSGVCTATAGASAHDVFMLHGPASAPPVTIVARGTFEVGVSDMDCQNGSNAYAAVSLNGMVVRVTCRPPYPPIYPPYIDLPFTLAAGSTFDLYLGASAESDPSWIASASASISLSFPDLPEGYYIDSCQGFTIGDVLGARPTSWGRLKTIYR